MYVSKDGKTDDELLGADGVDNDCGSDDNVDRGGASGRTWFAAAAAAVPPAATDTSGPRVELQSLQ